MLNLLHRAEQRGETLCTEDVCASFQHTAVNMLVENTLRAAEDTGSKTLVVAGGVAANSHLRHHLSELCKKKGRALYIPPISLCGDNGAMVASQAYFELLDGKYAPSDLNAYAADFVE